MSLGPVNQGAQPPAQIVVSFSDGPVLIAPAHDPEQPQGASAPAKSPDARRLRIAGLKLEMSLMQQRAAVVAAELAQLEEQEESTHE